MIVNPAEKEERRKVSMASGNKKSAKENREENTKGSNSGERDEGL